MIDHERELRNELNEETKRKIELQRAEDAMTNHWERAYGDE